MREFRHDKNNPLTVLLAVVGYITCLLSLSSLGEHWLADFLRWKGFLADAIEGYQRLVYPIFEALPFGVPLRAYDYLVLGLIISATYFRATIKLWLSSPLFGLISTSLDDELSRKVALVSALAIGFFLTVLLWPLFIVFACIGSLLPIEFQRQLAIRFWSWLGATLLGLAILLSINAAL